MSGPARWKIDRHVPIANIASLGLFLLTQTAVLSYGWATMAARIEALERDRATASTAVEVAVRSSTALSERVVEVKTRLDGVVESMSEIKALLRQVPTRAAP